VGLLFLDSYKIKSRDEQKTKRYVFWETLPIKKHEGGECNIWWVLNIHTENVSDETYSEGRKQCFP